MIGLIAVIVLLTALMVIDLGAAYKEFRRDKNKTKLLARGALFAILGLIIMNSVFAVLGIELDMPIVDTRLVRTPRLPVERLAKPLRIAMKKRKK